LGRSLGPDWHTADLRRRAAVPPDRPVRIRAMRTALIILGLLFALAPFVVPSQFVVNVAVLTAMSAFLGQAWNIAGGFGGLFSFGHAAFFGIGAYAGAVVQMRLGLNPWL